MHDTKSRDEHLSLKISIHVVTLTFILRETTQHGEHLCEVILKSMHVAVILENKCFILLFDLLSPRETLTTDTVTPEFSCDTPPHYEEHLSRFMLKYLHAYESYAKSGHKSSELDTKSNL
jgi:hypothetical protein